MRVPLVLLAVLERAHQAVAVVGFESEPLFLGRIGGRESGGQIDVAIVPGEGDEAVKLRAQARMWRPG